MDENITEGIVKAGPIDFNIKIEPIDEEIEKQALDVSNIKGFDYENQTIDKELKIKQEIKQEVKIEPMGQNFNE